MNVYFIDATYLKTDVLNALFNALKVKVAFSFIQEKELPKEIIYFFGKRFLRHSQIFEQLFVLINTKEVFWNIQALKYR